MTPTKLDPQKQIFGSLVFTEEMPKKEKKEHEKSTPKVSIASLIAYNGLALAFFDGADTVRLHHVLISLGVGGLCSFPLDQKDGGNRNNGDGRGD